MENRLLKPDGWIKGSEPFVFLREGYFKTVRFSWFGLRQVGKHNEWNWHQRKHFRLFDAWLTPTLKLDIVNLGVENLYDP